MSYGDYVEQITYLLLLKMAAERSAPPYNQASIVPAAYAWPTLLAKDGDELFGHYRHLLEKLGQRRRHSKHNTGMTDSSRPTPPTQARNPLHGVTLEVVVTQLAAYYGWEELAARIPVRCFAFEPSVKSSLKFLRRTPWAREKVEGLYLYMLREQRRHNGLHGRSDARL